MAWVFNGQINNSIFKLTFFLVLSANLLGQTVLLKDGSKINGAITESSKTQITIITEFGEINIPRDNIYQIEGHNTLQSDLNARVILKSGTEIEGVIQEQNEVHIVIETVFGKQIINREKIENIVNILPNIEQLYVDSPNYKRKLNRLDHRDAKENSPPDNPREIDVNDLILLKTRKTVQALGTRKGKHGEFFFQSTLSPRFKGYSDEEKTTIYTFYKEGTQWKVLRFESSVYYMFKYAPAFINKSLATFNEFTWSLRIYDENELIVDEIFSINKNVTVKGERPSQSRGTQIGTIEEFDFPEILYRGLTFQPSIWFSWANGFHGDNYKFDYWFPVEVDVGYSRLPRNLNKGKVTFKKR